MNRTASQAKTSPQLHLIHFPWDNQHRLKADENDFDHTPVDSLRRYAPDFEVRLWTYSKIRDLCLEHYPRVWAGLEECAHPVMLVDVLRWVVVHHFGGIYWQMNATPLREMSAYLPGEGKAVRLFTEFVLSEEKRRAIAREPIRSGEPEESTRVLIQVFAARPREAFVEKVIEFLLGRVGKYTPQKDYDILYITGNAAVSTAYDQFGKNDTAVELIGLDESKRMLKWHYAGSWRKDKSSATAHSPSNHIVSPTRLDRFPKIGTFIYRWRKHPHESMLDKKDAALQRKTCAPHILDWLHKQAIQSVYEAPSGIMDESNSTINNYSAGDPNPKVVALNRRNLSSLRCQHINMLYSKFPKADLFICTDFLELLSYSEATRVLRRIMASKPRYLALTGYRFLNHTWDTALGDFRPLYFNLAPFKFPSPQEILPLPSIPDSRPDRCLMIWKAADMERAIHSWA